MVNKAEISCVYASFILIDDDVAITAEKISTILKSANVEVEPYWPSLYAKSLEGINVKELISSIGSGAGAGPAVAVAGAPAAAAAAAAPAAAEKKEEKEDSDEGSDDDMGFGLFE